jgi:hypothetical protein
VRLVKKWNLGDATLEYTTKGLDEDSNIEHSSDREILGSVAVDSVRVRCPKCYQPYKIFASDIKEPRPRFECRKCESQFWLPFPEALNRVEQIGFPVSWLNVKAEGTKKSEAQISSDPQIHTAGEEDEQFERTCSNCGKRHGLKLRECPHCLVLVEKADAVQQDRLEGIKSTPQLRELWQHVTNDFEAIDAHDAFLLEAERQRCLDYAAKRYQELEEAMGPDPVIQKMQKKIDVLLSRGVDVVAHSGSQPSQSRVEQVASKPVKSRTWIRFSNFVLLLALVVCVVGMLIPGGRNMVGVGAAIGFFAFAMRFLFGESAPQSL